MSSGGGGGPTQTTQTQQQSRTDPWAPSQPLLMNLLNSLGGVGTNLTPEQTAAISKLTGEASNVPSFGPQGTQAVNNLFGASTDPSQQMLLGGYGNFQKTLAPYMDPNYTNPYTNPALKGTMDTLGQDVRNQINSTWNAAGRGGSPGWAQNMARGQEQALAPLLLGQYNTNVGQQQAAAGAGFQGASTAASNLAGLQQIPLQNQIAAMGAAGQIPGLLTMPGTTQLGAANTAYGAPISNIAQVAGVTTPIAGLGQSSIGSGTSTTQQQIPLLNQIMGAGMGAAGIFGSMFNPMTISDVRAKSDIKPVGILFDGLPIYSYKYKADPTQRPQIGLLAQDVEEVIPEAVSEIGGLKMIDYGLATARAANTLPA